MIIKERTWKEQVDNDPIHGKIYEQLQRNNVFTSDYMTFDSLGNCYVKSVNLRGRCIRYPECLSAVQAWTHYQQLPFSCYYGRLETSNFVCCPEAYKTSPTLPAYSVFTQSPQEHLSERECSLIYNNNFKHRSNRHRRDLNVLTNSNENCLKPVIEEIIEKKVFARREVVAGLSTRHDEFPFMVIAIRKLESPSVVRLGGKNLNDQDIEEIKIVQVIPHPRYDPALAYNDIAVAKLAKLSRASPVCLWPYSDLPQQMLTAAGYGQTKFAGPRSSSLLKVFVKAMTNENCVRFYKHEERLKYGIDLGQICAGDPRGKMDTCQSYKMINHQLIADNAGNNYVLNFSGYPTTEDVQQMNFSQDIRHVFAYYNLAIMHAHGMGVADLDYEVAQSNAASLLDRGDVTIFHDRNEDLIRAFYYWKRAAAQGYSATQVKLDYYYYYGWGTNVDFETAAALYRKCCLI
uniref:Peptidase S1 domain-containing protein n=1 Tax=Glossina pallidipes TaxID=7398 RepID=A0A1B0A8T2_GLOPL